MGIILNSPKNFFCYLTMIEQSTSAANTSYTGSNASLKMNQQENTVDMSAFPVVDLKQIVVPWG